MSDDLKEFLVHGGAKNACNVILRNWTDDNDLNRQLVETLLVMSMFKMEGLGVPVA